MLFIIYYIIILIFYSNKIKFNNKNSKKSKKSKNSKKKTFI